MEESLRIKEFIQVPSIEEFDSQIEPQNTPAVFRGCLKDWKAFCSWNPASGGLDYLQERVGFAVVEVMLSRSAPIFYGDIRSHERVPVLFSSFMEFCKRTSLSKDNGHTVCSELEKHQSPAPDADLCSSFMKAGEQIYLAQVPILSKENEERVQLEILREDIELPSFLVSKKLTSINLWMNNAQSRSNTHYDPHHNLLCIVAGCKQVVLWPPSAGPLLYPMPIYGEASNHSSVALDSPDFSIHPRFQSAFDHSQKVVLRAGDALFIPEGWFHQVDSDELTIALNFWWQSNVMSSMLEHMDAYYMRRILRRLIDKEMNAMLPKTSVRDLHNLRDCTNQLPDNSKTEHESKLNLNTKLDDLGPQALETLHQLVSLVHAGVSTMNQQDQSTSTSVPGVIPDKDGKQIRETKSCSLEDDSIASILWNMEPLTLQAVFMAMVLNFPRTLEGLVLHMLSPVGAEVLTRKFDELDPQMTEEDRSTFYQRFYSVFDDQSSAMDAILNGKEAFAQQAFRNALQMYMGITIDGSKLQTQVADSVIGRS